MFWFSDPKTRGILAPKPGIEPSFPALEAKLFFLETKLLTTGPQGKFLIPWFLIFIPMLNITLISVNSISIHTGTLARI